MNEPRIFISMGTPYTEQQEQFRDELEQFLRDRCSVNPRIIGKNEYPEGNPLTKIRSSMAQCHGVIVVAYERKFLGAGYEKRSGPSPKELHNLAYTTPWNHIESAMAFTLGLPLYILCQRGLIEEGLIESKLDWYVQTIEIDKEELRKPQVANSLSSWIDNRVRPLSKKPRFFRSIEGSIKISDMTPNEIAGTIALMVGIFGAGAAAATFFPKLF